MEQRTVSRRLTTKMLVIAGAALLCVLASAKPSKADVLRGRCHSQITGTDLGFVYGADENELNANCAKIAMDPIVDNVQVICRGECSGPAPQPSPPKPVVHFCSLPSADDMRTAHKGDSARISPGEYRYAENPVPAGISEIWIYCRMGDDWEKVFCLPSPSGDACTNRGFFIGEIGFTWTPSEKRWLVQIQGINGTHDRTRILDLFYKTR